MTFSSQPNKFYLLALKAALAAGREIMQVYDGNFSVDEKQDGSPITEADRRANDCIMQTLAPSGLPIISEEHPIDTYSRRTHWEYFWLVDPLDGTKEFVNRNGEFTVNIALVHRQTPAFGILTAPALNLGYIGLQGTGAYKIENLENLSDLITHSDNSFGQLLKLLTPLHPGQSSGPPVLASSRSHINPENRNMIHALWGSEVQPEMLYKGSALKFGLLAEGKAHYYLRNDKIWEWDTAAGHALLLAAGGDLLCWPGATPLVYNKESMRNPAFVACASKLDSDLLKPKFPL